MKLLRRPISASDRIPDRFCVISMEFLSLSRRRSSSWNVPQRRWARRNVCRSQADEHLKWDDHIKHTVSGCYAILSILRKLKYLAKYELRKQLGETLILSKLARLCRYLVFCPLTQFLLRRLQRAQFAATSFVLGHYVKNFRDVLKIGWLPINERRDLSLLKSCFKALHNTETWPDYLKITKQEFPKELRSSNSIRLSGPDRKRHFPR